jgi:hypothetical protein
VYFYRPYVGRLAHFGVCASGCVPSNLRRSSQLRLDPFDMVNQALRYGEESAPHRRIARTKWKFGGRDDTAGERDRLRRSPSPCRGEGRDSNTVFRSRGPPHAEWSLQSLSLLENSDASKSTPDSSISPSSHAAGVPCGSSLWYSSSLFNTQDSYRPACTPETKSESTNPIAAASRRRSPLVKPPVPSGGCAANKAFRRSSKRPASAARARALSALTDSGPRKQRMRYSTAITRASIAVAMRTPFSSSNCRQYGHCGSSKRIMDLFALERPTITPPWGV